MKPNPRIRKTVKWGGVVLALLIVTAWFVSGWGFALWISPTWLMLGVSEGNVSIEQLPTSTPDERRAGWIMHRESWPLLTPAYWPFPSWGTYSGTTSGWYFDQPLLGLLLPIVPVTAFAWWRDAVARRRERVGHCSKCGYDRAGLAAQTVCPECGATPA